jgi:pimeloyl-ACP methyl ester carboxylesterase
MTTPRLSFVQVGREDGLYRMVYREWGDAANPRVVLCVHGLTRNGRDFTALAEALSADYRVIAPDVVGRGDSDYLRQPLGYQLPYYVQDMLVLLARLQVEAVDWVGTSMGGLIGLLLAALPNNPIQRLLLNDVGPELPAAAIQRIGAYVGQGGSFTDRATAERYVRTIMTSFGPHSEADWARLIDPQLAVDGAGWRLNYDPAIAAPFRSGLAGQNMDLWPLYERITALVWLLRGADSDLLSAATAEAMTTRGPKAHRVDFNGVGHAPSLVGADQIAVVRQFLASALAD